MEVAEVDLPIQEQVDLEPLTHPSGSRPSEHTHAAGCGAPVLDRMLPEGRHFVPLVFAESSVPRHGLASVLRELTNVPTIPGGVNPIC